MLNYERLIIRFAFIFEDEQASSRYNNFRRSLLCKLCICCRMHTTRYELRFTKSLKLAFWDDFDYVRLVAKMKVQPDMDKVAILDQQTRTSTLGFNSTQVAGILNLFSTVLGSSTALGEMTNRNLVLGNTKKNYRSSIIVFRLSLQRCRYYF